MTTAAVPLDAPEAEKRRTIKLLTEGTLSVRVFSRPGYTPLYLEVQRKDASLPRKDREKRRSLGHANEKQAVAEAYEVFTALLAQQPAKRLEGKGPTLGALVEQYLASYAFAGTTERVREERRTMLTMVLGFGQWRTRPATHLGQEDLLAYMHARTSGSYIHKDGRKVSARRAQAELQTLRTALNWAYGTKVQGKRLVSEKVFDGLTIPEAGRPTQVAVSEADFLALWGARARHAAPNYGLALALAYIYGKRAHSVRHLAWDAVNLTEEPRLLGSVAIPAGWLFWSPEFDKEDEAGVFPIPDDLRALFLAWQSHPCRKASPWVFYAPKNPDAPITRVSFQQWGDRAYTLAGITKPRQGGWHGVRRNFAGRNASLTKAAMTVGGWKDASTFLRYQQPAAEALLGVLNNRVPLVTG